MVTKNNEAVETEELVILLLAERNTPGFQAVLLNRWVLQMAWYQCKQRQLARWC